MTGWIMWRPPAADEEIARWAVNHPPQLRDLRGDLRRLVTAGRLPTVADADDLADRLVIVATELAGNALRHGRPPTAVVLFRSDGRLIIEVSDHDADAVPAVDPQRPPAAGGMGLRMVERLAERVGWYPSAPGKHVWAAVRLSGA
ncbi:MULTISPECIES: ATP-binding protein [unclassified Actinoplanes]|uniref:ATP-binding protein n=1 Tax=unclassified Actinoplanes TaxID=2626549 RepID=UPI0007C4835F|nr:MULTISPECIES: ATP-binding protein [unclassified Actinoplanes]